MTLGVNIINQMVKMNNPISDAHHQISELEWQSWTFISKYIVYGINFMLIYVYLFGNHD